MNGHQKAEDIRDVQSCEWCPKVILEIKNTYRENAAFKPSLAYSTQYTDTIFD